MALLWIDGFDHYGSGGTSRTNMTMEGWLSVYGAASAASTTRSRTGAHSFYANNYDTHIVGSARRGFGGTKTTVGVGANLYMEGYISAADGSPGFRFIDSMAVVNVSVALGPSGEVRAYRGHVSAGNLLGQSANGVIPINGWFHIEAKVFFHDSAGTVEVRVNGVTVLNLTGQDTVYGSSAEGSSVSIFGQSPAAAYYDDMYAWDTTGSVNNDFIGDRRVYTRFPSADTATENWTCSTGTDSYAMVDEASPNDDTDYLSTASNGTTVLSLPALSSVTMVNAVQVLHRSRKTDSGTCSIRAGLVSSGTAGNGATTALGTSYLGYNDVFNIDPNTGAAWAAAAASAVQVKIERTA